MTKTSRLDLLLVNPGGRSRIYQSLAAELAAVEPPVWLGLLATYVRKRGLSVAVIDADAEELSADEVARRVVDARPLLTAVVAHGHNPSASTQVMPEAGNICRALRLHAPELRTLLVGGHVAALPQRTLKDEDADYVCTGEGPVTLVELLAALRGGRGEDLSKVRGLGYRIGGIAHFNPPAPMITALDHDMPEIAWDLLPMRRYRAHNWHGWGQPDRQPYAALYTTLGCPYRCTFCCIQAPFREGEQLSGYKSSANSYRFWSPAAVIAQIDILVRVYGVRNIKFADEMFVLNRNHIAAISNLIRERGYDLNIWAYARVDTVQDGMAEQLKAGGFNWLAFGVEAGSERVRREAQKRFEIEDVHRTIARVREAGINVGANFIFGLPEDDLETMQETLDLALDINAEYANFYSAMAYPGSALYDLAVREGWPLPASWAGFSQHAVDTLPLPTRHISGAEVLRFRDQAFQTYYRHPRYLQAMEQRFGAETVRRITAMAGHRLERQHAAPPARSLAA